MLAKFISKDRIEVYDESSKVIEYLENGRVKIMVNPTEKALKTIPSYSDYTGDYRVYHELKNSEIIPYDIETKKKIIGYELINGIIYEKTSIVDKL